MDTKEIGFTLENILTKIDSVFDQETVDALGKIFEEIDCSFNLERIRRSWKPKIGDRIRPKNDIIGSISYGFNKRIIIAIKEKSFTTVCDCYEGTEDIWNKENVIWHPSIEDLLQFFTETM